jgi:hypothetical protein
MSTKNRILLVVIALLAIIIGAGYIVMKPNTSNYFNKKITVVDDTLGINEDISELSMNEASALLLSDLNNKEFYIYQNGEVVDTIQFRNLNLDDEMTAIKMQNDNLLGFEKLKANTLSLHLTLSIKNDNVKTIVSNLNCVNNYIENEDAYVEVQDGSMVIVPEVYGTQVDTNSLVNEIVKAFNGSKNSINLDELNVYTKPSILQTNTTLLSKVETFNKCTSISFTYTFGDQTEVLSKELIASWISLDDNNEITFDDDAMLEYIKTLASKYNTYGTTRKFVTSNGKTINVPAGDYGWTISQTKEVEALKSDLENGGIIKREPTWLYKGYGSYVYGDGTDIGNSYVEIDIASQHLWLYVDGELKVESDFVSGNESNGNGTPSGVFGLTYKTRNATLKGQGYSTPVSYWMPFNMNIGMHDATWRSSFGGSIYKTSGSHGCINLPKDAAKEIYGYIDTYFPVIVYDEEELNG